MKKRIVEVLILASFMTVFIITNRNTQKEVTETIQVANISKSITPELAVEAKDYSELYTPSLDEQQEEIYNEILYGELEEVAILVQAEAGNQDELGKRYVADVVFNRVDDYRYPEYISDVIYQLDPVQFSTTVDGAMGKAGYEIDEDIFRLVLEEYEHRTNSEIGYFRTGHYSECGKPAFKHGDHYFSNL